MSERPMLGRGDRGEWVRQLQQSLINAGLDPGQADGIFGGMTEQAVLDFQANGGLDADGLVGPATWDALGVSEPEDDQTDQDQTDQDQTDQDQTDQDQTDQDQTDQLDDTPSPTNTDWTEVDGDARMRYVVALLVDRYQYPVNGAAGIVGNLWAESGVLPNRIEGSSSVTPLRARDFAGAVVEFTAEQVMNRNRGSGVGPALPGVGLAQWTSSARRSGLFKHTHEGRLLGAEVLFDMDAQVDYLVQEMRNSYSRVHTAITDDAVSVEEACDEVVYSFEVPGSVLEEGTKLPRSDPKVQQTFATRRAHADRARRAYGEQ